MDGGLDEITRAELIEREPCPRCGHRPGRCARANSGVVAVDYHTGRYAKILTLKSGPAIRIPAARGPGRTRQPAPHPTSTRNSSRGPATASATPASPARARTSPDRSGF
ncbi:hypothetical protein B9S64_32220 [Streptomyces sp. SM18]|uniref:hypothetical protein n=1 Tax=Streptomyces sp. SM5 TaxID=402233 RepID=UPI000CD4EADE|nr:hypothetical protein [Streptomyces sp. SM5]AWL42243.1 hypothetical protein B9S64_32220 [Streptomyces sp. SM18]